jgi:hypothetical protein
VKKASLPNGSYVTNAYDTLARMTLILRVIKCVEKVRGEKWEKFRDRHGDRGRDVVLHLGRRLCGMKLKELADWMGLKNYGSVAMTVQRHELALQQDKTERKLWDQINQMLNV